MNHLKSVATRIAFVALLLTLGFAPAASATTNTFEILMDLDNNQATGCDVPTLSTPFHGVEQILITTVTTSGSTAQVTALQKETCNAGVFSAPAPVPAPVGHPLPWTVGTLNGTSSPSFIETYFPLSSSVIPNPTSVRLGVLAFDSSNALTDDLLATAAGGPIVLQAVSPLDIPTLGDGGLMALGLVLALAAMALLRRRRTAGTVLLALLLLSAAGLSWAAVGSTDLNGATTSEWNGSNLLASTGPSTPHPDVEALYGFKDPTLNALAFRVDSQLVFTTPQTITFTSTPPASATVGGPTYTVTATASSGLPVTFTIDPSASAVCSISGSTVSFTGVGTCVIDANQAGDSNFDPAPQAQQSFGVGKGAQTIAFTSTAPASATVGGPTYTVTATASPSGLPVSFTIDASATAVCSITGSTVSFTGVGTCVVDADQAGDANYNAAPQAQQSFAVGKGAQTIAFTSTAPASATVGGPTYTVTATASPSGLPVSFTIDASATSVCSISGSTVSFTAIGTCVIDADQAGDANYNAAPQVQQSFSVGKGDQTITFTSTAPATAKVGGPTYTVTATASSSLTVAFTIDASATSVCSISGSTVSFLAIGTCVIDANQAGDANWNAAPQVQQSFPVGKGDQTISFTSTAPASATVGGPTYTVTATASPSGLPVAFTIDASATSVCSISGSTVSFIAVGTCVIDANQAGNANYNAAPQVQQSFPVGKGNQTISFTSTAPATAKVGGPTYTVTATASPSGLPVAFTIDATATSVCSISGSTVSFLAVGTCVIDANQAGNANYNAATQVQQSFPVAKGDQTISFTSTAPATAKVGGPTYTVTATASPSGLPVTFTIDASATSVCSIAGSTVSFTGVGTCVIDANQAGNANYNAATQVQQSFPVAKGDQTISFTSTAPASAKVGGPTYTVTATASPSGLPVAFTIDATATSVCSIAGSTVSFTGVGTCVIDANQAGNASYNAAPQVQQSFPVAKGDQTISFTSTAPAGATVGGPAYTVTATASPSGLPVAFTIDAAATSVCSISGSTVSFIGVGTCVIDANQAGNGNYNAAPQVQQSFAVGKGSQTISFTSTAPVGATVGGPTYTVTATATSGLPVTFTIDATATSVCSISGSTVSLIGAGTCVIDANQAGNANYNAAPQVQQSFAVSKGSQTISFTSAAPVGAAVGGPPYTVTATATSGLPVTFTIDATATSVCSISGSTVSFIGAGTCVIDANQPGNANYNAAPQAQQSFAVGKGSQTISFTSTAPVGATVGSGSYTVTATATSGLTVTFTIDATATSVCSISGSTVSFIGAGTCVIDANQPGNANYNAAPQVQQSFAIAKGSQTISFTSTPPSPAIVGGTYTVSATATSGLPVTFTIDATATSVCSISGSTVTFIGTGTCVIDANQAGNASYNAAPQVQQSFQVDKAPQITSANATSFTSTVAGTFTVTTTGFPTGASMSITESGDTLPSGVTFVNNNDGTATLAGTPAAGTQGVYHITITANNGIPPNATQSFTLTVLNNPPQLTTNPISYTTPGNTQLQVAGATLPGVAAWNDSQSINAKAQPTDTDGPGPLSIVAASGTTGNGGTYSINTDGSFTYVPAAGFTGSDSFTYQVTDTQSTTTGTVNITVGQRVWYIRDVVDANNPAGGDGRSTNAFDTIAAFNAATTNAGDIIYVFQGNTATTPLSGSITLKDSQRLWGQGIALDLTSNGFGVLVNATGQPRIQSTAASTPAVSIPATAGNRNFVEVRGLDLQTTGATSNAVDVPSSGTNTVSVTISDNNVRGATGKGVNLSEGGTGSFTATLNNNTLAATGNAFDANTLAGAGTLTISFTNNAVVSNATGININGAAGGTTWITNFANNAVSQNNVGTGIAITSAKFDSVPGGGYDQVTGGTTVVGASGNGVGGSGVVMSNVSGDLAFTNLQIFADGGAALSLTGTGAVNTVAGTGTRVTVGAGVGIFEAIGGPAASVTSATIDLQLASLKSTNSSTTGVSLDTITGTFSAGSGSTITNATGTDFNVNAGNAAITYNGTITDTTGRLVSVTNTTGGTKSFTGAISDTGSGTGQGIFLNSNTGATISFSAPLTLSTGSNNAFTATGGGTVTSTDTTSTIITTTGTALNVANTTIGASGLKFKSISAGTAASGPTNGIVLNNTGTSGTLTLSGTGSAGSGGTIQKTIAEGILITGPANASFSWMSIQNPGTHGISSTTANNLTIANTSITDAAGNNTSDDGIHTGNTSGTLTIASCTINGARHQGITIDNNNTNMAALNMTGTTVTNTPGGDGMLMQMRGTSVLTTGTISNNTFSSNSATGLQVNNADTGNISSLTVQSNTVTGNNAGMDFDLSQASSMTISVLSNTITGSHTQALNLVTSTTATGGSMTATLRNNNIGTAGVNDSGSAIGNGIRVANGGLNVSLTIDGNVIREVPNGRGIDIEAQAYTPNLNLKAKIINNQIVRPSGTNQNIGCGANVPCPSASIFVLSDSNSLGGFDHVCTVITGNTAYDPTSWPAGGEAAFYFARRTSASNTLSLEGTQANVTSQIQSTNTITNLTSAGVVDENTSGTVSIVPAGTCGGFPP